MKNAFWLVAVIIFLLGGGGPDARGEGLTFVSKDAIIKRTNPDFQDFVRQYLNFSDNYDIRECLDYGLKTNQTDKALKYCELYFRENRGLNLLPASFLRTRAGAMRYSTELSAVLYNYLISAKKYDAEGCNAAWQEWVNSKRKEHQIRKNQSYKESNDMCQTFFQP